MLRNTLWIITFGLAPLLAGCGGESRPRVHRHLPPGPRPLPQFRGEAWSPPPAQPVSPRPTLPSLRGKKVVIDAGHGGKDPGTRGVSRLPEKTIVLLIANEVARLLQDRGATVIRTRTGDQFVDLDERAAIAERHRTNLFVAIHADSAPRREASGSTLYVARGASAQSRKAGQTLQWAFKLAGIPCRGIQAAGFRVLVGHSRPAVLVECGFLTNRTDANRLNTQDYRSRVAKAIARGIADHLSE